MTVDEQSEAFRQLIEAYIEIMNRWARANGENISTD